MNIVKGNEKEKKRKTEIQDKINTGERKLIEERKWTSSGLGSRCPMSYGYSRIIESAEESRLCAPCS